MKTASFLITLALFLICCNYKKDVVDHSLKFPDSILPSKIRDTLRKFPFVKKAQSYFDSASNHTEVVTFTMDTFRNKLYPIAVFYVKEEKRFQKLYRFEIDPQTMEIKINDIDSGRYITIEEYYKLNPQDKY